MHQEDALRQRLLQALNRLELNCTLASWCTRGFSISIDKFYCRQMLRRQSA